MMKFQRLLYQFFIFIFSICYFISCCQANKVSVGGKDGWVLQPSETYDHWSGRNRFQVNDSIVFSYKKGSDSVLVVNKDDYNSCNTKNPIEKLEDGNSEFKFDRSGPFYFISGINDHCAKGQKLLVKVLAVKAPIPKSPVPQAQPPTANPPKGLGPISPSPKSQAPSPAEMSPISPSPKSQAPSPAEMSPISPSPKSQAPSPAEMSPNSSSPSPSPYAVSPPSPPNSPVPAAAPGTSASSPPSPGPAPSGGGSSTNSSSSPQAQNQKSYAMTVTPSSFLVLSVVLLVTIVLSGEFLGGGI